MRTWNSVLAVLSFVALFSGCSDIASSKPSTEDTKAALSEFLRTDFTGKSDVSLDGLENIRVGDFQPELGGWPVYADFSISYQENGINMTQHGAAGTAAAYAKIEGGATVCFTPELLKQLVEQMDQGVAGAFLSL